MCEPIEPVVGPGKFQWNAGGWWGTSLGATAWMIPTAAFLAGNGQLLLALLPLAGVLLTLALATALWRRRDRVAPFRALMLLLTFLAVCTPIVWFGVATAGTAEALAHMNWPRSRVLGLGALLIVPALMVWFVYLEHTDGGPPRPAPPPHPGGRR